MDERTDLIFEMADFAIRRAVKAGVEGVSINSGVANVISTRFANSTIHQNFRDFETVFELTVIKGQKRSMMTSNAIIDEAAVSWIVDRACKIIGALPDDPNFPGILTEPQNYLKLRLTDPAAKNLNSGDVVDKILAGINIAHALSDKVESVSGNINIRDGSNYYLSSEGHEALTPITSVSSAVNVMANDEHGESRSNIAFGNREFSKLPFEEEASHVAQRALLGLNPQEIEPQKYSVILDFQAAADQMSFLGRAISAKAVIDHVSFLKDKLGEQVFSESITIVNDPHNPKLLGARALDAEGIATQKFTLVRGGILKNLAYDRLSAKRMGSITNGCNLNHRFFGPLPYPFAMTVESGHQSRQQLIEGMDDGLLVTNLHYSNFADQSRGIMTGMTKDGLFRIKNGEIVGSCRNLRFTDSLPGMLSTAEVSQEVSQVFPFWGILMGQAFAVPAMRIDSMQFTSKTTH
ncbi:MAG: TldD/PmbA family protein [Candidatus Hodarchaeales archaeon]|jgi:PmbA protein